MKALRFSQRAQTLYNPCGQISRISHAPAEAPACSDYEGLLSFHRDTNPPTPKQRRYAEQFFLRQPPKILYSSSTFRNVPRGGVPEVTFLGRSNVGKSSLLNRLMGKDLCHTSKNPGRTKTMNFFAVGGEDEQGNAGKITVLDMPGYGHKSRAEWGEEIMKYLAGRKQLARAFVLIDSKHGLKESDEVLLQSLRENAISHQVVLSKVDRILFSKKQKASVERLRRKATILQEKADSIGSRLDSLDVHGPKALGEILACSTTASVERGKFLGINNLRWSVLAATGLHERRMLPKIDETNSAKTMAEQPLV